MTLPNDEKDHLDRLLADNEWMTKEIERLRAYAKHERSLGAEAPMIELQSARQEIERLRAAFEPVTAVELDATPGLDGQIAREIFAHLGPLYRQRKP